MVGHSLDPRLQVIIETVGYIFLPLTYLASAYTVSLWSCAKLSNYPGIPEYRFQAIAKVNTANFVENLVDATV